MWWRRGRPLFVVGSVAVVLLGTVGCHDYRFVLPGDVKDGDGRAMGGCRVELLVRWTYSANSSGYVTREAVTTADGSFRFDVFAPLNGSYRLRVNHPGYQEWLVEAPSTGVPNRIHVTLLRTGDSSGGEAPTSE